MIYVLRLDDDSTGAQTTRDVLAIKTQERAEQALIILRAWIAGVRKAVASNPTMPKHAAEAAHTAVNPWPFLGVPDITCWYFGDRWAVIIAEIPDFYPEHNQ